MVNKILKLKKDLIMESIGFVLNVEYEIATRLYPKTLTTHYINQLHIITTTYKKYNYNLIIEAIENDDYEKVLKLLNDLRNKSYIVDMVGYRLCGFLDNHGMGDLKYEFSDFAYRLTVLVEDVIKEFEVK